MSVANSFMSRWRSAIFLFSVNPDIVSLIELVIPEAMMREE